MVLRVPADEFIRSARHLPVIDVRAPAEFSRGHIPDAVSLPLFDDPERADVGIIFHKRGREEAIRKGLEIVGPKMKDYVDRALQLAKEKKLLIYCWRGGMRSESMAWLLATAGLEMTLLEQGYKAYRHCVHTLFEKPQPMIITGGMTGCGKTELITSLRNNGVQVIDLEHLASHKGSVFGNLGQQEQPTNEQFENDLAGQWLSLDPARPVILEDESITIGRNSIPVALFRQMLKAPMIYIDMPVEARVERLFREYAHFDPQQLTGMLGKITKRLGGDNAKAAAMAIENGELRKAIRIALIYYDKAYLHEIGRRDSKNIKVLTAKDDQIEKLYPDFLLAMSKMNP